MLKNVRDENYEKPFLLFIFRTNTRQKGEKWERVKSNWRVAVSRLEKEAEKNNIARNKGKLDSARYRFEPYKLSVEISNVPTWNIHEGILATLNICQSLYGSFLFDFLFIKHSWRMSKRVSHSTIQIIKSLFVVRNKLLLLWALLQKRRIIIISSQRDLLFITVFLLSSILQSCLHKRS